MFGSRAVATGVLALALALTLGACRERDGGTAGVTSADCGRACLEGFVDDYLSALAAGDPSRAPIAADAVYVENNERLPVGAGAWRTIDGLGGYRHYFADTAAGRAAAITVVEEHGTPIILDLALDVVDGEITEIESLVIRDPNGARRYEERGAPHPKFTEIVPVEQRLPREALAAVADSYLSGMQRNDPNGDYSFFHEDCDRWEHAQQTTNQDPEEYGHSTDTVFVTLGCREQFETGFLGFVTRIRDRRYVVIDEARQTVFGFVFLDHAGTIRSIPLADGGTFEVPSYFSTPRTLEVGEAWRVEDGKLRQIEMTLTELPYGARPAFGADAAPPGDDFAPGTAAAPFAADCGRACLASVAERFRAAVLAHDPSELPMTADVVYTENGQRLAPGDGLWGTLTQWRDAGVVALEPDAGTLVLAAPHVETDVPGFVLARLHVAGGRVDELEVLVAREEAAGERGGTLTLFAPRITPAFDAAAFTGLGTLLADSGAAGASPARRAARFLDALGARDASRAELGEACTHRVNGARAASCARVIEEGLFASVERVREPRTWAADAETGLTVDLALLDVEPADAAAAETAASTGPYSIVSAQLYATDRSGVRRVESVAVPVPYGMSSDW